MSWLGNLLDSEVRAAARQARIEALRHEAATMKARRENLERAYEAADNSRQWPRRGDTRSGNGSMDAARTTLRSWSRWLEENHDLAAGIFDDLVKKVVGCGMQVSPMVSTRGGEPAEAVNRKLAQLWEDWTQSFPETSRSLPWPTVESLVCRTWLRDGDLFVQHVEGLGTARHRSRVPYSIELIEGDQVPFDLGRDSTPTQNRIVHGVELNDWREPVAFHLYKEHPGDLGVMGTSQMLALLTQSMKRVPAERLSHIKFVRRIGQVRGVPVLHACLRRIEDIKEYEESERVAARVAAAFCAVIQRNADFAGSANLSTSGVREMEMAPGMIFDNLLPGESINTIGSDRPNTNLQSFRDSQLRAVAAGVGASYSGVSRNYNGTYSAQRQELVESWTGYEMMREHLVGSFYRPIWQRFVRMAVAAGLVPLAGADQDTLARADWIGPAMPWIDPVKEVEAQRIAVESRFKARHMVIREAQYDPRIVDEQIEADTMAAPAPAAAPAAPPVPVQDDETDDQEDAA